MSSSESSRYSFLLFIPFILTSCLRLRSSSRPSSFNADISLGLSPGSCLGRETSLLSVQVSHNHESPSSSFFNSQTKACFSQSSLPFGETSWAYQRFRKDKRVPETSVLVLHCGFIVCPYYLFIYYLSGFRDKQVKSLIHLCHVSKLSDHTWNVHFSWGFVETGGGGSCHIIMNGVNTNTVTLHLNLLKDKNFFSFQTRCFWFSNYLTKTGDFIHHHFSSSSHLSDVYYIINVMIQLQPSL